MDEPTILIVDDDANLRKTLCAILRLKGYEAIDAVTGAEGLSLLNKRKVNLALIDLNLPDMSGIEVLARLKETSPMTQAIILTGSATLDSAIEATNKGAFSYLLKPYDVEQLLLHIGRSIEKQQAEEEIIRQKTELERVNSELRGLYEETKAVSLHDPLTGLANRRLMQLEMDKTFEVAKRYDEPLSVVMLDIDHFKRYNDTHGHARGDTLLARIAQVLLSIVRNADHVFRYGGEEFLLMLPGTHRPGARNLAERIRRAVETATEVTVSLGVCSCRKTTKRYEDLIEEADKALYGAKQKGRNRVEVWDG
jgi:two-component system cell cycle response regulator